MDAKKASQEDSSLKYSSVTEANKDKVNLQ
jgi:hypothetical protein